MTYVSNGDHDVIPVSDGVKLTITPKNGGDYTLLRQHNNNNDDVCLESGVPSSLIIISSFRFGVFFKWVKFFLLFLFLAGSVFVFFKWVGPFFMDKGIIPILNWERSTFSTPMLALLIFTTVALFPTILLPSTPSMWVAGMTFGYGFGFLLIMSALIIGVSLPYLISSLFYRKIQGWLERYPKKALIIRLAGEGKWLDQFRSVSLIRISPFPYIIYNYCAVATDVKYGPYFLGSILGMVPDVLVALYTGILIKTLADASDKRSSLSVQNIIVDVVGFAATVATTIICTILAKRRLKAMPLEEEQPLLQ